MEEKPDGSGKPHGKARARNHCRDNGHSGWSGPQRDPSRRKRTASVLANDRRNPGAGSGGGGRGTGGKRGVAVGSQNLGVMSCSVTCGRRGVWLDHGSRAVVVRTRGATAL